MDPKDIPAQYWPESQHFVDSLKTIVENNTIDDPQAKRMNAQIIQYIEKQIQVKGYSGTYLEKCQALEIIADRALTQSVAKLVGQKEQVGQVTVFSDCINQFKQDLHKKRKDFEEQSS